MYQDNDLFFQTDILYITLYNSFYYQFCLLLEYCSAGNLRSYLIDHQREFRQSLDYYDMYGHMDTSQISSTPNVVGIPHDIRLLYRWAHQARRTGISLEYSFISYRVFPRYISILFHFIT